jgi:hypothetical protein
MSKPKCIRAWRCHDSAITSIIYISNLTEGMGEFIITCSTDWCCRVWQIDGAYVGVFGQDFKWDLNESNTFQSTVILANKEKKETKSTEEIDHNENQYQLYKKRRVWFLFYIQMNFQSQILNIL